MLDDLEDIIEILPKPDFNDSFFSLINGLINMFDEEILKLNQELEMLDDSEFEMKTEFQKEIESLKLKKTICETLKKEVLEDENENHLVHGQVKKIIFATTSFGNVCLERDMKSFSEEYLEAIKMCLERLEEGFEESNTVKGKKLISDKRMEGIHEVKEFKVRVIYRMLTPDTVYVMMAKMKKSDNGKKDREEIVTRSKSVDQEYEVLKINMENPETKARIIEENEVIRNRIFASIEEKKRGKNV